MQVMVRTPVIFQAAAVLCVSHLGEPAVQRAVGQQRCLRLCMVSAQPGGQPVKEALLGPHDK